MLINGTEDLRVQKTIAAIKESFEELICEKDFHEIRVTELCARAKINKKTFYHYYPTLDDLLAERMREFAWEGWRRQDLIRFGKFTDKWSSHPVLPGEESGYTTVFPIPADVLDLNPLLKQNPGY